MIWTVEYQLVKGDAWRRIPVVATRSELAWISWRAWRLQRGIVDYYAAQVASCSLLSAILEASTPAGCQCSQEGDYCNVHPNCACGCPRHAHDSGGCNRGRLDCDCRRYQPLEITR